MLTDDDLLRELEAGFREETRELRYAGRVPRGPRSAVPWTALPLSAAAALVLPQLGGGPGVVTAEPSSPPPPAASSPGSPAAPTATVSPTAMVTDTIELAGATFRYRHAEGTPTPATNLYLGVEPPADAREVDLTGSADAAFAERAWVGTEPRLGEEGLFLETTSEGIGRHVFFTAPGITADDWERMVTTGSN